MHLAYQMETSVSVREYTKMHVHLISWILLLGVQQRKVFSFWLLRESGYELITRLFKVNL